MALAYVPGYTHLSGGLVTPSRLNNLVGAMSVSMGASKLLGTVGAGAAVEIGYSAAGLALLQAADTAAQRTALFDSGNLILSGWEDPTSGVIFWGAVGDNYIFHRGTSGHTYHRVAGVDVLDLSAGGVALTGVLGVSGLFTASGGIALASTFAGEMRTAADIVYAANTVPADVAGLSIALAAGGTYHFEADLYITWGATGGFKFALGGTCTITDLAAVVATDMGTSGGRFTSLLVALGPTAASTPSGGGSGLTHIVGTITVNAAGTLLLQASQWAATATSTIKKGSTFRVRKVS